MRENRTHGSEGREANAFLTPIKIENHTQLVWQQGHGTDLAELLLQLLPGITPVFAQVHVTVEAGRDDYVGLLLSKNHEALFWRDPP